MKTCTICGNPLPKVKKSKQARQVTCSPKCRNTYNARVSAEKRSQMLRNKLQCNKSYPKLRGKHAHRRVMEEKLGRKLSPNEIVHHKNENKQDFSPNNLELTTRKQHTTLHSTRYTRMYLILKLRHCFLLTGKIPSSDSLNKYKWMPSYSTYLHYFKSLSNALREANI